MSELVFQTEGKCVWKGQIEELVSWALEARKFLKEQGKTSLLTMPPITWEQRVRILLDKFPGDAENG